MITPKVGLVQGSVRGVSIPFQRRGNVGLCMAMSCKIRLQYALFDAHIWTVTDSGLKVKALSEIICKCFIVYDGFFLQCD